MNNVTIYESPCPAIVSDAIGVRNNPWNMLTKADRERAKRADELIRQYDNQLAPAMYAVTGPLAYGINLAVRAEYQRNGILEETLPKSYFWDIERIDVTIAGRLTITVKPDYMHSLEEFAKIIDKVLPQTPTMYAMQLAQQSNTPNRLEVRTAQNCIDMGIVRSYLAACRRYRP